MAKSAKDIKSIQQSADSKRIGLHKELALGGKPAASGKGK